MNDSLYIIEVIEDGEKMQYEYGNRVHAEEHFNNEKSCVLLAYTDGKYYFIKAK